MFSLQSAWDVILRTSQEVEYPLSIVHLDVGLLVLLLACAWMHGP